MPRSVLPGRRASAAAADDDDDDTSLLVAGEDGAQFRAHRDPATGRMFYQDAASGRTTWTDPGGAQGGAPPAWLGRHDMVDNPMRKHRKSAAAPGADRASGQLIAGHDGAEFLSHRDPNTGRLYYADATSGRTTWTDPETPQDARRGAPVAMVDNPIKVSSHAAAAAAAARMEPLEIDAGTNNSGGSAARGKDTTNDSALARLDRACDRHRRCCCCCYPDGWGWPCCHRTDVRIRVGARACLLLTVVLALVWLVALVQLARFGACATTRDPDARCFTIDAIDVLDLCSDGIPVHVRVRLDNPGTSSWLAVGSVSAALTYKPASTSSMTIGALEEQHAFVKGWSASGNDTDVAAVVSSSSSSSSDGGWIPPGKSTVLVAARIHMDAGEGSAAAGALVSGQMNRKSFKILVNASVPCVLRLWPFPVSFTFPLNQVFECTTVEDGRYICGMGTEDIAHRAALAPTPETPPKLLSVGVMDTPQALENLTLGIEMAMVMDLGEISVNLPDLSLDVRWWGNETGEAGETGQTAEGDARERAASREERVALRVQLAAMHVRAGANVFRVFATVPREPPAAASAAAPPQAGTWDAAAADTASRFQVHQIGFLLRSFLAGNTTALLIRGPSAASVGREACFAARAAAAVFPDIRIPIQADNATNASSCTPEPAPLVFHEFALEGYRGNTAHLNANLSLGVPFVVWGRIPSLSLDVYADGVAPAHVDPLIRIQTFPVRVANAGHNGPLLLPVDVRGLLDLGPFMDTIQGKNLTQLDVRITGSRGVSFLSEVMESGFSLRMNDVFAEGAAAEDTSTESESEVACPQAAAVAAAPAAAISKPNLTVAVTSTGDHIGVASSLTLFEWPLEFAVSVPSAISVEVVNNASLQAHQLQPWRARVDLQPFRFAPEASQERHVALTVSLNTTDRGATLKELLTDIVAGRDVAIQITDGDGSGEQYDVASQKDGRNQVRVSVNPGYFFTKAASDSSGDAGSNTTTTAVLRPKSVELRSVDSMNTTIDLPCLLSGLCDRNHVPTAIGVDTEAVVSMDVDALPLNIHLRAPPVSFSLLRSTTADPTSWTRLAALVLQQARIDVGEFEPSGDFTTAQRVEVHDVKEAFRTLDMKSDPALNVTLRLQALPEGGTLLDTILSAAVVDIPFRDEHDGIRGNSVENATSTVVALELTSSPSAISLGAEITVDLGDLNGLSLGAAAGNFDLFQTGFAHPEEAVAASSVDISRLLACDDPPRGACHVGTISWPTILLPDKSVSRTSFAAALLGAEIASGEYDGELLGQFAAQMVAGRSTTMTVNGSMAKPVAFKIILPRTDSNSSSSSSPSATSTTPVNTSHPVETIRLDGISTGGTVVDVPCLLGGTMPRCGVDGPPSQFTAMTTSFVRLTRSLPDSVEVTGSIPGLTVQGSVQLADGNPTLWPLASVSLNGFDLSKSLLAISSNTTMTRSDSFTQAYFAVDRAVENITLVVCGGDAGLWPEPSLLRSMAANFEFRVKLTPEEYAPPAAPTPSDTPASVPKSSLSVEVMPDGMNGLTTVSLLTVHQDDLPEGLPTLACRGFEASMTAGATASSPGDKTLTLSVPAFSLSRSENPAASPLTQIRSTVTCLGVAELTAARQIVASMQDEAFGSVGVRLSGMAPNGASLDVRAEVGKVNFTSARALLRNYTQTALALDEIHLVGGDTVGSPVRLPCVLDTICKSTLDAVDEDNSFTFAAVYSLKIPSLPIRLMFNVQGLALALDDNTHQEFLKLKVDSLRWDSMTAERTEQLVRLRVESGTRARDVIRAIGGLEYRLFLHGDTNDNALAYIWAPREAVKIDIPASTSNPNDDRFNPDWYLPIASVGSWSMTTSTTEEARFQIDFPIHWPADIPLTFEQPEIRVQYNGRADQTLPTVDLARADLRGGRAGSTFAEGQRADLVIQPNTTDQLNRIWLYAVSDQSSGSQFCDYSFTEAAYVDEANCAIGAAARDLIAGEATPLQLLVSYRVPPSTISDSAGGGQVITVSLGMHLFDSGWDATWSRLRPAWPADDRFKLIPSGPPVGPESPLDIGSALMSTLWGMTSGAISGDQYLTLRLKISNPFAFPITATGVSLRARFDDVDGTDFGVCTYHPPATEFLVGSKRTTAQFNVQIDAGQSAWSPYVNAKLDNTAETACRIADEYWRAKRLCLHIEDGLVDVAFGNFRVTVPLVLSGLSCIADNDCVREPDCQVFASDADGREVLRYDTLGSAHAAAWQVNGDASFSTNYLTVAAHQNKLGSAFTVATYDVRDSFEITFDYEAVASSWLGHGNGITLVITDGAANSIGEHGGAGSVGTDDWGQGYKNLPGNSVGVIIDVYDDRFGLFRNGGWQTGDQDDNNDDIPDRWCNNVAFRRAAGITAKCKGFIVAPAVVTDFGPGSDNSDLYGRRNTCRLRYDGVRKTMFFSMLDGTTWRTFLQGQVDLEEVLGTNAAAARIGFTSSTGSVYYDQYRVHSLRFRTGQISAVQSTVQEDGRVVGAVHDEASKPFLLTIDGKDTCGHDRAVGGETISVRLVHTESGTVVNVPSACPGTAPEANAGICDHEVSNPGSQPVAGQPVGGLHRVRFLTSVAGWYTVELTAGGEVHNVGSVYVAE